MNYNQSWIETSRSKTSFGRRGLRTFLQFDMESHWLQKRLGLSQETQAKGGGISITIDEGCGRNEREVDYL